jgi:hypothetical protein
MQGAMNIKVVIVVSDHVPEAIYRELPPRLRSEVFIDVSRPPHPHA